MSIRKFAIRVCKKLKPLFPTEALYLKTRFRLEMGYGLNLKSPKTFSEKIQWLKLYNRRPEYTTMVDKYAVKDYVAKKIGEKYVIPTLGVWNTPEEIEWNKLPERFVLKTTHGGGSGGVVICKNKATLDKQQVVEKLRASLRQDIAYYSCEWPYKNVPRRIIAEEYLDPSPEAEDLVDYKWYCFDGEPKYCQVIKDRNSIETIDFYDTEWNHQEFIGLNSFALHSKSIISRPHNLELQIEIARRLAKDIPFSRVDLYEIGYNEYFGEITLYPASGFGVFKPMEYNEKMGMMLNLPGEREGGAIIKIKSDGELLFSNPDLPDYKFFCFDGEVKFFKIDFDRQTNHRANYYDRNGNLMPFGEASFPPDPEKGIEIPSNLQDLITVAEKLAEGEHFCRIDLYDIKEKVYFGEITLYPASGFGKYDPEKYDEILGKLLTLPEKRVCGGGNNEAE